MTPMFASVHPDGNTIAFVNGNYSTGVFEIWSVQKDGSGLRRLTQAGIASACGVYSPDGQLYAFARGGGIKIMPSCGEVDPTPQAAAQLPPRHLSTPGVSAAWTKMNFSPDSKKLVMTARLNAGTEEALYTYDLTTNAFVQILPPIVRLPNGTMYQACYSRNPAYPNVLFGKKYNGASWDLFLVQDDGTNLRIIPPPVGGYYSSPSMTRDGLGILFQSSSGVYRADLDFVTATASNPEKLTNYRDITDVAAW